MPRSRPLHTLRLEFRQKLIELMRAGRSPEQLAQEFEPTVQTIRNWVAQADADGGKRPDVLTSVEREELGRLRKENRKLGDARSWQRPRPGSHEFLEGWYNPNRRHSRLGQISPIEFERRHSLHHERAT